MADTVGTIGDELHLLIKQGSTFTLDFTFTGVDLTGCTVRGQIRKTAQDATIAASFVYTAITPASGIFKMEISDENTALITCGDTVDDAASQYVWDMELEDSAGRVTPTHYGNVKVFREVTR